MPMILKYMLLPSDIGQDDIAVVKVPKGAIFRHLGVQRGQPTMWVEVKDPNAALEEHQILCATTGDPFTFDVCGEAHTPQFLGTVLLNHDSLVLHFYRLHRTADTETDYV